jgi:hypothetical protein
VIDTFRTIKQLVLLWIVTIILIGTVLSVYAEDRLVEGAMILAPVEGLNRIGKISEDTLESCLARIPERVTPEQRIVAQQTCQHEEATRKLESLAVKGD